MGRNFREASTGRAYNGKWQEMLLDAVCITDLFFKLVLRGLGLNPASLGHMVQLNHEQETADEGRGRQIGARALSERRG